MLTEKKKTVLIITLTGSALLIDMIMVLGFILVNETSSSYDRFLYEIRFVFWGWLLVFGLAGTAIGTTLYWKPGRLLLRGFIIFFSIIAIIFALAWLWLLIAMLTLEF